jgi:MipA family protein
MYFRRPSMDRVVGALLPVALLATGMQPAAAQDNTTSDGTQSAVVTDNQSSRESFSDHWNVLLGAGAINLPRYPGSRIDFTRGVPAVSVSYDRYFIGGGPGGGGPAGLGAYLVRTEHWAVGLTVGGDARKPRRASDDPILHGWGDIPATVRGGMFASYSIEWLSIRGSVSEGGHHEGVIASLGAEVKFHPTARLTLSFGPEVTWTDEQYAMTFFGIDAAQSQIAGISPYRARAGVNTVGGEAGARYALTRNWSLAAKVNYGRLQGDAANSPVTTDKTQRVISAFVMYRF